MKLVVTDTGPVNYLLLIECIDVLPELFDVVVLPTAVRNELVDFRTPPAIRSWVASPPAWVVVRSTGGPVTPLSDLGSGETEAIALAKEIHADLVLMDDRRAVVIAVEMGLAVAGTIGILARAAKLGLIDLPAAFQRLKATNFRYRQEIMDQFLKEVVGDKLR